MVNKLEVIDRTKRWVSDFVIGLGICPFAKHPFDKGLVDFQVFAGSDKEGCLEMLAREMTRLDTSSTTTLETTLIILPELVESFGDYLDLLDQMDEVLVNLKLEGIIQIASFHPRYQFGGSQPDDISNHTNRSPYPMIHLLREDSVYEATQRHADVDGIPDRNIKLLESMNAEEVRRYLK